MGVGARDGFTGGQALVGCTVRVYLNLVGKETRAVVHHRRAEECHWAGPAAIPALGILRLRAHHCD